MKKVRSNVTSRALHCTTAAEQSLEVKLRGSEVHDFDLYAIKKKIKKLEEFSEEQSYFTEEESPGPAGICLLRKIRVFKH